LFLTELPDFNVIVCTALAGKNTPLSLDEEIINKLRPGTIVVDLAAEKKGNSWITREKGTGRVEYKGIINLGYTDWPSHMPK